jgi:guanylate kinase
MTSPTTNPGLLFVVSAPSGAGKTSIVNALVADDPNIVVSVSHTTRPRRGNERDGEDYFFIDDSRFKAMRDAGEFFECAEVFGNYYGTSRGTVERELKGGRDVLLEIDWQGAAQIRRAFPAAVSLFILPPSRAALRQRLRQRGQDDAQAIERRTAEAVIEMSHHHEFDYLVVNDAFEDAVADVKSIVRSQRLRLAYQAVRHRQLVRDLLSNPKAIE